MKKMLLSLFLISSCSSYKSLYVDGQYESLSNQNHLTPIFNETDWIKVSSEFSSNLKECKNLPKKLFIGNLKNYTSEVINTDGLKNRMIKDLQSNNQLIFTTNESYYFRLDGEISEITQRAKEDLTKYYKITYHLINNEDILCTTQVEFRKRYKKW